MSNSASVRPILAAMGVVLVLGALLAAGPARAQLQIPDKFTNLKVLPKDISKDDLLETMHSFSIALGVRCNYCHVQEGGNPQGQFDWASDSKPEKSTARVMFQMVQLIDAKELPQITTKRADKVEVQCETCHRGLARPKLIEDVLSESYKAGGFDSLAAKYQSLHKAYYGTDAYNFSDRMLPELGHKLAGKDNPAVAVQLADFNLKWYPDSGMAYLEAGQAHAMAGDKDEAVKDLNKAIELNPALKDNAQRMLQRLQGGGGGK